MLTLSAQKMSEEVKRVFVTVGTTSFDELIQAVTEEKFLKLLNLKGYKHIILQIGKGQYVPTECPGVEGVKVEFYRYKASLKDDMCNASLVISHGGSGSIIESLTLCKPLVVVVNELLMDNHQTELARQLHQDGCLLYTSPCDLYKTVEQMEPSQLKRYEPGRPELFGRFLDSVMGFQEQEKQD